MGSGRVEVTIGRGGKGDVVKTFKDGKLVSTRIVRRRRRTGKPTPPQVMEDTKAISREEFERQRASRIEEDRTKFGRILAEERSQQRKFSGLLAQVPSRSFAGFTPSFLPLSPVGVSFEGERIIPSRGEVGRGVVREIFDIGSRGVGTLTRAGLPPEEAPKRISPEFVFQGETVFKGEKVSGIRREFKERPSQVVETAFNVGFPLAARATVFARTPIGIKIAGLVSKTEAKGVGLVSRTRLKFLEPFVKEKKPFAFKETKVGELVIKEEKISAGIGDTISSLKPEGVVSSKTISVTRPKGEVLGAKISEVTSITETRPSGIPKLTGAKGIVAQADEFTRIEGATTRGIKFKGIFKEVSERAEDVSEFRTKLIQRVKPKKAFDVAKQITEEFTPTQKPSPVVSLKPMVKTTITPRITQAKDVRVPIGIKTGTKDIVVSRLAFKDLTKGRGRAKTRLRRAVKQRDELLLSGDLMKETLSEKDIIGEITGELEKEDLRQRQRIIKPSPTPDLVFDPIIPIVPKVPPPVFFRKPSFDLGKPKRRVRGKKVSFTPSLAALTFDIRGKREPFGELTGLGIRAIPIKKKKKKKRKK